MHERLSVHSICFPGAGLRELAGYWRELGAHRVSLVSHQLFEAGSPLPRVEALRAEPIVRWRALPTPSCPAVTWSRVKSPGERHATRCRG